MSQVLVDFIGKTAAEAPDLYADASPITHVSKGDAPFLVIHGSGDTVIPVQQARDFVEKLRSVSRALVGYVELPGAGHGFDMTDGARTGSMATGT